MDVSCQQAWRLLSVILPLSSLSLDHFAIAQRMSHSYSCLDEDGFCEYLHVLECPKNSGIVVMGGTQKFPLSPDECSREHASCKERCCQPRLSANCTAVLETAVLKRLERKCSGKRKCKTLVPRRSVVCDFLGGEPIKAFLSSLRYNCIQGGTADTKDSVLSTTVSSRKEAAGALNDDTSVTSSTWPRRHNMNDVINTATTTFPTSQPTDRRGDSQGGAGERGQVLAVLARLSGWLPLLLAGSAILLLVWRKRRASRSSSDEAQSTAPAAGTQNTEAKDEDSTNGQTQGRRRDDTHKNSGQIERAHTDVESMGGAAVAVRMDSSGSDAESDYDRIGVQRRSSRDDGGDYGHLDVHSGGVEEDVNDHTWNEEHTEASSTGSTDVYIHPDPYGHPDPYDHPDPYGHPDLNSEGAEADSGHTCSDRQGHVRVVRNDYQNVEVHVPQQGAYYNVDIAYDEEHP